MKTADLSDLASHAARKGIELIEIEAEGQRYQLVVSANVQCGEINRPSNQPAGSFIKSMAIGVLRTTHPLRRTPEIAVGSAVRKGQIVAYLETGELLLPVTATDDGIVLRQLELEGSLVGYGTRLFGLDPATEIPLTPEGIG